MLTMLDGLRQMDLLSISVRMVLAVVCGGLIGLEREFKHRPAGFRTHILICLGAAMTTLTGQYLYLVLGYDTDVSRMGAQVIAGIGFIGAGTIIVTHRHQVKGLTTAAGLWAAAIVGLALGAGFYEGGVLATVLILVAELVFARMESRIFVRSTEVSLFVEYRDRAALDRVLDCFQEAGLTILNMEIARSEQPGGTTSTASFSLRVHRRQRMDELVGQLLTIPNLLSCEQESRQRKL